MPLSQRSNQRSRANRSARSIPRASSRSRRGISETFFYFSCFPVKFREHGLYYCLILGCCTVSLSVPVRSSGLLPGCGEKSAYGAVSIRHLPGGMAIANLVPSPYTPVSWIVMPVIARMSRTRNRPRPDVRDAPDEVVKPRSNMSSFCPAGFLRRRLHRSGGTRYRWDYRVP